MRILIAGGMGETGTYLTGSLARQGHQIRVFDYSLTASKAIPDSSIEYIQGNLADRKAVDSAVRGVDVIINLAWSFSNDPYVIFGGDIAGHINLLEAAAISGIRSFVYTSTATVYGRAVRHPVTEEHPCLVREARKPLYAIGKYTAEELCMHYHKTRGVPVTIFRFWWAFGDTIGGSHLRDLIKKALGGEPLEMVRGAGGAFLTMADLESGLMLAASNPAASGQIYNLGSLFLPWEAIGEMIVGLTRSDSPVNFIPSGEWKGPAFLNEVWDLDWSKAATELGFRPMVSSEALVGQFSEALKTCIAGVKA
jgi:UDP-glucose 4-epimerase